MLGEICLVEHKHRRGASQLSNVTIAYWLTLKSQSELGVREPTFHAWSFACNSTHCFCSKLRWTHELQHAKSHTKESRQEIFDGGASRQVAQSCTWSSRFRATGPSVHLLAVASARCQTTSKVVRTCITRHADQFTRARSRHSHTNAQA